MRLYLLLIILFCNYLPVYAADNQPEEMSILSGAGVLKGDIALSAPSDSLLKTIEEQKVMDNQPVVIDSDEAVEVKETIKYRESAYR